MYATPHVPVLPVFIFVTCNFEYLLYNYEASLHSSCVQIYHLLSTPHFQSSLLQTLCIHLICMSLLSIIFFFRLYFPFEHSFSVILSIRKISWVLHWFSHWCHLQCFTIFTPIVESTFIKTLENLPIQFQFENF